MEDNPQQTNESASSMQMTSQPGNALWISKEEYVRLRELEDSVRRSGFNPATVSRPETDTKALAKRTKMSKFFGYLVVILGLLVYLTLTADLPSYVGFFGVVGIVIFAALAIFSLIRDPSQAALEKESRRNAIESTASRITMNALSAIIFIFVVPPIIFVIIFMVLISTGQTRGS